MVEAWGDLYVIFSVSGFVTDMVRSDDFNGGGF